MERAYLAYDEVSHILQDPVSKIYNNMGVTRIDLEKYNRDVPIKLGFSFFDFEHVKQELLNMGIVGYFIVRQKRLPTILAQAMVLNISKNMRLPLIGNEICKVNDPYLKEDGKNSKHGLGHGSIYKCNTKDNNAYCLICPEFTVR